MVSGIHKGAWTITPVDKGDYCIIDLFQIGLSKEIILSVSFFLREQFGIHFKWS